MEEEIEMKNKNWIASILIVLGVLLMLYPAFSSYYSQWRQQQLAIDFPEAAADDPVVDELRLEPKQPEKTDAGQTPEQTLNQDSADNAIFWLQIPSISLSVGVLAGTSPSQLRIGPGWYPQSSLPGQGNTAIAGHRTMYGSWFSALPRLQSNDQILLYYQDQIFHYRVEKIFTIRSNDWSVVSANASPPALTLTTCHPSRRSDQRLAVRAVLVQISSSIPTGQ